MNLIRFKGDKEKALSTADLPTRGNREFAVTEDNQIIIIDSCGNYVHQTYPAVASESVINKTKFIWCIDEIKKYNKKIDNINKVFEENCEDSVYCPLSLEDTLIELLMTVFDDKHEAICFFICSLDFGEKWLPGMFMIDGKDVKLKTSEDLYDFLTGELND
ncbi:hypothetical protein [Lacrimispora amygdalina]|uniref:hypothetical protein n=1 Tax=Lacrimispora amygdalina TaxID=253257 RepID=UPI000BE35E7D|nr:hypothetical protein [Lacrimispora amygdalina]